MNTATQLNLGDRVKVTQTVRWRHRAATSDVVGTVVSCGQDQTGNWFAHNPSGRYVLQRMVLRKDDGECVDLEINRETTHFSPAEAVGLSQEA